MPARSLAVAALLALASIAPFARGEGFDGSIPEDVRHAIERLSQAPPAPHAPATRDWAAAKPQIIKLWKEFLAAAPGLDEHRRYAAKHPLTVAFDYLPGKIGTFDRKTRRMVFSDFFFEQRWDQIKTRDDAARLLALESFPGFAHVLRDEMMRADLAEHGFMYTGGWLEDEVIHNKEEATTIRFVSRFIDKESLWGPFYGSNEEIVQAASKGNAGLADYVRDHYRGIPSLFYPRRDQEDYDPDLRTIRQTTDLEHHVLAHRQEVDDLERNLAACAKDGTYVIYRKVPYNPRSPFPTRNACDPGEISAGDGIGGVQACRRKCEASEQAAWSAEAAEARKRLHFFADAAGLDRLRAYYRSELARFGIRPEELK